MSGRTEKARRAIKIRRQPEQFKICEGCDAILYRAAASCPRCNTYRFDTDLQKIRAAAIRIFKS